MLDRYSRKEMRDIWTEESKFEAWLKMEIHTCEAWSELGFIPKKDVQDLWDHAKLDIPRILEIEKETRHDVVAFTRQVSETIPTDAKKWVHYGLTSTDVVDTANGYRIKKANDILQSGLGNMMWTIKQMAVKYKNTPMIGRTHGIHADITSFGLKCALWYDEMTRNLKRFKEARDIIEIGKISGAVGTFANTPPFVQDYVCKKLGINSAAISTQTLQRDRYAQYMSTLAMIASTIEKIGVEIRHLQRTEVREVEEGFAKGQKGSSAMPHKRNPIASENMAGCARVMRGYMITSFENIALWHERDISHSSAERIILPDATALLDYMLTRMNNVLKNLVVFQDRMESNIYITNGVIFAQRVMTKLITKGLTREQAYDTVQPLAMKSWTEGISYRKLLDASSIVSSRLTPADLDDAFDLNHHLKQVDTIFNRVGIK